jgi:uncharacterized protein YbjT (DUF2867 family)
MKIVVSGSTGLIGTKLAQRLRKQGHEVTAAPLELGIGTITGDGLAEALAGAQVVVHMSIFPSFENQASAEFFKTSGRNLMAAEAVAGVRHHLALLVVGTECLREGSYLRAKVAQENLIKASGVPYTILRSTQSFEFVNSIIKSGVDGDVVLLSSALMRPIASDDVAAALADLAVGPPLNATVDVAGAEASRHDDLDRNLSPARRERLQVIADIHARYVARA